MRKLTLLLITILLSAMSQRLKVINIEGEVGVYGNMPHTFIAIKDKTNNKIYKIENAKDFDLIHKQNSVIYVKALLLDEDPIFKNVKRVQILKISPKD